MISKHWVVMNKLEESFSNITTISFMLEELNEAMDNNRIDAAHDIAHALNAFLPVYTDNWDRNFKKAWDQVVKENVTEALKEALESQKECPPCDTLACADHLTDE